MNTLEFIYILRTLIGRPRFEYSILTSFPPWSGWSCVAFIFLCFLLLGWTAEAWVVSDELSWCWKSIKFPWKISKGKSIWMGQVINPELVFIPLLVLCRRVLALLCHTALVGVLNHYYRFRLILQLVIFAYSEFLFGRDQNCRSGAVLYRSA